MKRLIPLALLGLLLPGQASAKKKKAPEPVAAAPAPDPEAWRATQPAPGPDGSWEAPVAAKFTLSNGIPVYLVENHGLPLVTVEVLMGVGREANPKGKAGLTALTASMLDEGTKAHTGNQLAAALADLGADLSVWGGGDSSAVLMDALGAEALAPSLDLLTEVLRQPRFDKGDFARVKQQTLDQISADKSEPREVTRRVFARELMGADHPYGSATVGDATSVASIQLSDVQNLYKTWWHAGNASLVVTGDTTQAELQPLLEARLASWAKGKATRGAIATPAAPTATRVVFVEQPGAVQSVLMVGRPALARTDPAFMPAYLAGTLFGGMFGSRLNMNLREEHGWSYGAFGGFSEDRVVGIFAARTSVQADKTAPAVSEIIKELEAARRDPTADEMKLTNDYLAKSIPGNFETNHATAQAFASVLSNGLGPDAWRKYTAELGSVSPTQLGAAAKDWLDPTHMVVVVTGPRTVEIEGEGGAKETVDVVAGLKELGFTYAEVAR